MALAVRLLSVLTASRELEPPAKGALRLFRDRAGQAGASQPVTLPPTTIESVSGFAMSLMA